MSLVSNLTTAFTRVGTEAKALRTLLNGNAADNTALTTTAKSTLVAAINEVNAKPAGVSTLAALTDTSIAAPATGHLIRWNGTAWVNVLGTTYFDAAGAATAAQAASQPLDSDLTSIAALATTVYGRAFLALANQAALVALLPASADAVVGVERNATQAEVNAGTLDTAAVTPLKLQTRLAAYAQPLDSDLTAIAALTTTSYGQNLLTLANQAALFALIGLDTDVTLAANSDVKIASQKAVKAYADALIGANDAMVFKGVIDCSTNPNYPAANRGDTYKVSVAGKIGGASGPNVEAGDTLLCITDGTVAGTQAAVGSAWNILQANIDGAVTGPASAVSTDFATFSGTSGKVIQDSGITLDTDGTLTANSATKIPSQSAVKTYAQPLDSDLTAIAALTSAADKMAYATGAGTWALTTLTSFARTLLDDVDVATAQGTLQVYSQTQIGDPTTDFAAVFVAALV